MNFQVIPTLMNTLKLYMVADQVPEDSSAQDSGEHSDSTPSGPISSADAKIPMLPTSLDKNLAAPRVTSPDPEVDAPVFIPLKTIMNPIVPPTRVGSRGGLMTCPYDKKSRKTSRSPPSPSASLVRDKKSQCLEDSPEDSVDLLPSLMNTTGPSILPSQSGDLTLENTEFIKLRTLDSDGSFKKFP